MFSPEHLDVTSHHLQKVLVVPANCGLMSKEPSARSPRSEELVLFFIAPLFQPELHRPCGRHQVHGFTVPLLVLSSANALILAVQYSDGALMLRLSSSHWTKRQISSCHFPPRSSTCCLRRVEPRKQRVWHLIRQPCAFAALSSLTIQKVGTSLMMPMNPSEENC